MIQQSLSQQKTAQLSASLKGELTRSILLAFVAGTGLWIDLLWIPVPTSFALYNRLKFLFNQQLSTHLALPMFYFVLGIMGALLLRQRHLEGAWPTWPQSRLLCAMASLLLVRSVLWVTGDDPFYGLAFGFPVAFFSFLLFRLKVITSCQIGLEGLGVGSLLLFTIIHALFLQPFISDWPGPYNAVTGHYRTVPNIALFFLFTPVVVGLSALVVYGAHFLEKRRRIVIHPANFRYALLLFVGGSLLAFVLLFVLPPLSGHGNPHHYLGEYGIYIALASGLWIFGLALLLSQLFYKTTWLWLICTIPLVFYDLIVGGPVVDNSGGAFTGIVLWFTGLFLAAYLLKRATAFSSREKPL